MKNFCEAYPNIPSIYISRNPLSSSREWTKTRDGVYIVNKDYNAQARLITSLLDEGKIVPRS